MTVEKYLLFHLSSEVCFVMIQSTCWLTLWAGITFPQTQRQVSAWLTVRSCCFIDLWMCGHVCVPVVCVKISDYHYAVFNILSGLPPLAGTFVGAGGSRQDTGNRLVQSTKLVRCSRYWTDGFQQSSPWLSTSCFTRSVPKTPVLQQADDSNVTWTPWYKHIFNNHSVFVDCIRF